MRGPHNLWRLLRTVATLERAGAMVFVLDAFDAPRQVRVAARLMGRPLQWLGYQGDSSLPPVTRAIVAMGPAYVKFGQILATRPDVVGMEMAQQLSLLLNKIPPFSRIDARAEVERELGIKVDEVFSEFSEPVAAASIAQVHKARIKATGQAVAVKVLRPKIEQAFRRDVDSFYFGATVIEAFAPFSRRLRPKEVIRHFDGVVRGELDLRLESAAASEYAANTTHDEGFQLPSVQWELSSKRVMTLAWVDGTPLGDNLALDAAGHDRKILGERLLQLFLKHALRDGYFHADMHQGNLMVAANGDIVAYDFGIMGHIDEYTRRVYAEILYGFIRRDYKRVAEVHFAASYVPPTMDVDEFARALRSVGEPIFGMDAEHISMSNVLAYLFEVTERFGMETRTELILLQRTMVVVEGVARSLHPNVNIWQAARPVVEDYIKGSIGPRAIARDVRSIFQVLSRFGPRAPGLVEAALIRHMHPVQEKQYDSGWRYFLACILGLGIGIVLMLIIDFLI
ncbi:MAG: 2-polyprenylphenol 6-hydroxylase [Aestuariivita sp.]|nr:2-polyprenylphenol 6-hydroxylase [Aestuariivita sp.]MCY4345680.1 2-polyprenylphenol 6-hydroxylase [Aestuariivita sp.]